MSSLSGSRSEAATPTDACPSGNAATSASDGNSYPEACGLLDKLRLYPRASTVKGANAYLPETPPRLVLYARISR
jgi:hypothetical protein